MKTQTHIEQKIQQKYNSLSKNHKVIVDFVLNNLNKMPFLSVQDISGETNKSVASVVRVAQQLGYKGYSELRDEIAKSFQLKLSNQDFFPLFDKNKLKTDTLTLVANQDIKNINETLNLIDRKIFNDVVDTILKAKRVYTMGLGISSILAEALAYQLCIVAVDSKPFVHNYSSFVEQILFLDKNDLIVAFSFPPCFPCWIVLISYL